MNGISRTKPPAFRFPTRLIVIGAGRSFLEKHSDLGSAAKRTQEGHSRFRRQKNELIVARIIDLTERPLSISVDLAWLGIIQALGMDRSTSQRHETRTSISAVSLSVDWLCVTELSANRVLFDFA